MRSARELLALDEEDIRRLLLSIDELEGISDGDKLKTLQRISRVLRAIMLVIAGRGGVRAAGS